MVENFKYVINYIWRDKFLRHTLGGSLIIVIFMVIYASSCQADSFDKCVTECIFDVIQIEDCIWDEKQYWDSIQSSGYQIKKSCQELIRNERDYCIGDCAREANNSLLQYYDKEVKNFPDVN